MVSEYTQTGAAEVGSSGDYWNGIAGWSGTAVALKDSGRNDTTVTMTYSGDSYYAQGASETAYDSSLAPLMIDYLLAGDLTWTQNKSNRIDVSLSGLAPGSYDLYLYAGATLPANFAPRAVTYTVTGSTTAVKTISPDNIMSDLVEGKNYGHVAVDVGSNGLLTIVGVNAGSDKEFNLNGFQLRSIPEPGTLTLLVLGTLGLLAYAWRKKR